MHRISRGRDSIKSTSVVFGVAFNPISSTWSSFCENTLKVLSEHKSEAEAQAACRRYEATLWLMNGRPLADLARGAI
jgi:hypothetical protein